MRVERIGDATLYLADCMEVLPTLQQSGAQAYSPDLRVNPADAQGYGHLAGDNPAPISAVITDPPFEAEAHTLKRRKLGVTDGAGGREVVVDALPFAAMDEDVRAGVCEQIARLCSGWALYFCQAEAVADWREAAERAGQKYKRAMVWVKPDGMPQFSGDRPGMGYESIVAAWCGRGRSRWNGGGRVGVFVCNKNDGAGPAPHPTTKPTRLMAELVELFSDFGDTVLDPFMGSGTTGVACAQMGRRFIGIEREPKYFDIACRRIEEAYKQPALIPHEAPRMEQEPLL